MLAVHMRKDGRKRQMAPEPGFFRVHAPPVGRGRNVVCDAGDPCEAVFRRRRSAERSGMMQPDAVENVRVLGPELF